MSDQRLTLRGGRSVSELSDAELEEEAKRRRAARTRGAVLRQSPPATSAKRTPPRGDKRGGPLSRRELEQYLANLELTPGATLDAVREQYFKLRERYDPDRRTSEDKRRLAEKLTDELKRAYEAVSAHFESRGEI